MVATNAMEEGIDVSNCEYVVRYNWFGTTKSHIQVRRRLARPIERLAVPTLSAQPRGREGPHFWGRVRRGGEHHS